ncbi:GlxA family transcriptional regulator [Halomonas sp. HNIBRBA4712]|uniref:GlxA family transcriptional regulator n=1 Tax=Halomonas sp. HNIBRBA4712 TaxID=3373087 RepID=UPI0037468187
MAHAPHSSPSSACQRIGVLLLPGFSLMAHACLVEPLLLANQQRGQGSYQIVTLGLEKGSVRSGAGPRIETDYGLDQVQGDFDGVFIAAPSPLPYPLPARLVGWLGSLGTRTVLGGLAGGSEVLARCGLLDGYRATLDPPRLDALGGAYPSVTFTSGPFEIDRDRMSSASGIATLELALALLQRRWGEEAARAVGKQYAGSRPGFEEPSPCAHASKPGHAPQSLTEALALMDANLEEPLSTQELAAHLGISRRQLERLYKKYLHTVPSRYYLNLRLREAQRRLRESDQPIGEIALGVGFSSGAHFSTAYRNHFGLTPREERLVP